MKPRFDHERQITDLIDQYIREKEELLEDAAADDHLADVLRDTKEAHRIARIRNDADAKRKRAKWRDGRLETLKEKLAEFRTKQLPGLSDDGSVATS